MKIIPWILFLAFAAGAAFFYTENQQRAIELSSAKSKLQELKAAAVELDELKSHGPKITEEEVDRLRKENAEVFKLRAEVNQLRKEKTQWKENQRVELALAAQQQEQQQQTPPEQPAPEQDDEATRLKREHAMLCIANLKMIEDGKTKWAEANGKNGGDAVTVNDISPYLPNLTMPVCPDTGSYNLNEIGIPASCSVEGHSLLP